VMKPANKAEGPSAARPAEEKHAAESVERRAGTKGNNPRGEVGVKSKFSKQPHTK
jgi:hypothetical protein